MKKLILSLVAGVALVGCAQKDDSGVSAKVEVSTGDSDVSSSLKKLGNDVERAAEKAGDKLEKGAEAVKDTFEEGKEKTEAGLKKAGEKIEEAGENISNP